MMCFAHHLALGCRDKGLVHKLVKQFQPQQLKIFKTGFPPSIF